MATLPVVCRHCEFGGLVATSRHGQIQATLGVTEQCPLCGTEAPVVPGTYALAGTTMVVVDAPPDSLATLQRLARSLQSQREDSVDDGHMSNLQLAVLYGSMVLVAVVDLVFVAFR